MRDTGERAVTARWREDAWRTSGGRGDQPVQSTCHEPRPCTEPDAANRRSSARLLRPPRASPPTTRRSAHLLLEPARVLQVATQARAQALDALLADQVPLPERAEAPPERDAPVTQVLHTLVDRGLQVAGVGAQHARQVLRVAFGEYFCIAAKHETNM